MCKQVELIWPKCTTCVHFVGQDTNAIASPMPTRKRSNITMDQRRLLWIGNTIEVPIVNQVVVHKALAVFAYV